MDLLEELKTWRRHEEGGRAQKSPAEVPQPSRGGEQGSGEPFAELLIAQETLDEWDYGPGLDTHLPLPLPCPAMSPLGMGPSGRG